MPLQQFIRRQTVDPNSERGIKTEFIPFRTGEPVPDILFHKIPVQGETYVYKFADGTIQRQVGRDDYFMTFSHRPVIEIVTEAEYDRKRL